MFTGIVETIGTVRAWTPRQSGVDINFQTSYLDLKLGESIAVDGVCLSAVPGENGSFTAHASAETLACTTLEQLALGERVHLERAMLPSTRFGGHIMTGHVDGVGTLESIHIHGECRELRFSVPESLVRFIAPKGSIAVNGTSLTVNDVSRQGSAETGFSVMLVPLTLEATCFSTYTVGKRVNLEADLLAKYVAQWLGRPSTYVP